MNDLTSHEILAITGGNAPPCYTFSLEHWGIPISIQIGTCEMNP
jgi:hypothetical protein